MPGSSITRRLLVCLFTLAVEGFRVQSARVQIDNILSGVAPEATQSEQPPATQQLSNVSDTVLEKEDSTGDQNQEGDDKEDWHSIHGRVEQNGEDEGEMSMALEEGKDDGDMSMSVACCCRDGPCGEDEFGARGLIARQHSYELKVSAFKPNVCCKELKGKCNKDNPIGADFSVCVPKSSTKVMPGVQPRRARMCRQQDVMVSHHFFHLGDDGCHPYLNKDGSFANESAITTYGLLDCPFPFRKDRRDILVADQARRALLLGFMEHTPASPLDVAFACNVATTGRLDISGTLWERALRGSLLHLALWDEDAKIGFACETLRLLPLMWGKVGFLDSGMADEAYYEGHNYPRSMFGQPLTGWHQYQGSKCIRYSEFSQEETKYARRVLRAILPTWSTHVFEQDKKGMRLKAAETVFGVWRPVSYENELLRECGREDDVDFARQPLRSLQSDRAMERSATTCKKTFPCAYTDSECAAKTKPCKCSCQKALCINFALDVASTMHAAAKLPRCLVWHPFMEHAVLD